MNSRACFFGVAKASLSPLSERRIVPLAISEKFVEPKVVSLSENDDANESLVASISDDPIANQMSDRAAFIPLREPDLRSQLVGHFGLTSDEQAGFNRFCNRLQAIFHVEHLPILLELEELYDSLDPDSQLLDLEPGDEERRSRVANLLMDRLSSVLYSAHYKRLTQEELEKAIEIGCQWGVKLDVDFTIFDRLEIFARGYRKVVRHRRRWGNFYRLESIELPEFQRLILAFRIHDDGSEKTVKEEEDLLDGKFVYLKTFKNIPETDIEMLLPGSKVRLTKLDQAKILFPTLSGLAITIYKIARGVLVVSLAFTLHQLYDQLLGWIVLLGATGTYIYKSVMSYFRTKSKYQFGLTKSLYLKNLDNNLGVIYRILFEAEEQELNEVILAYAMLLKHPDAMRIGMTEEQLDETVEAFVHESTGIDVDFEVHDALGKLARLNLAMVDAEGRWTVNSLSESNQTLNAFWRALIDQQNINRPVEDSNN